MDFPIVLCYDVVLNDFKCTTVAKEMCGSLVVTFATIRLPGPRFKPRPGKKFGSRFLLLTHPETSPQEPKMVSVPIPSPDTKRGLVVGCR